MALRPRYASGTPTITPPKAMRRLSVSSCRASRARPAPIAARTAISRWRVAARDSRRFETFTHAISSSSPTAAKRIHSVSRRPLGNVSLNESRPTRQRLSGNCAGSRCARSATIGRRSASACASVTPAFSRPSTCTFLTPSMTLPCSKTTGTYTSAPRHMKRLGITPTTVRLTPLSSIWRPTTDGSPPNWRCQNLNPSTTTGSAPGTPSAGRTVRPSSGGTPITSKVFVVM